MDGYGYPQPYYPEPASSNLPIIIGAVVVLLVMAIAAYYFMKTPNPESSTDDNSNISDLPVIDIPDIPDIPEPPPGIVTVPPPPPPKLPTITAPRASEVPAGWEVVTDKHWFGGGGGFAPIKRTWLECLNECKDGITAQDGTYHACKGFNLTSRGYCMKAWAASADKLWTDKPASYAISTPLAGRKL